MNVVELKMTLGCLLYFVINSAFEMQSAYSSLEEYAHVEWNIKDDMVRRIVTDSFAKDATGLFDEHSFNAINLSKKMLLHYTERKNQGFKALASAFTANCPESEKRFFYPRPLLSENMNFPDCTTCETSGSEYILLRRLQDKCKKFDVTDMFLIMLLKTIENEAAFISYNNEMSLSEASKAFAAMSMCLYQSSKEKNIQSDDMIVTESAILVCSLDFIGIKDFKFQKLFENKPNYMSAASLYIELVRECVLDDLFESLSITRANLIFSGGRHLHFFVPNTKNASEKIAAMVEKTNDFFVKRFSTKLYMSYGLAELSPQDLMHEHKACEQWYENIFNTIAGMKYDLEARKYTARQIKTINDNLECDTAARLEKQLLQDIKYLADHSDDDSCFCVSNQLLDGLPLCYNRYLTVCDTPCETENNIRIYKKPNAISVDDNFSVCAHLCPIIKVDSLQHFATLSKSNQYGILRFDIDDFKTHMLWLQNQGEVKFSPALQMMMSKQFALFLRLYVNKISEQNNKFSNVVMIHEGADDAFFIGPWSEIRPFSIMVAQLYNRYTNGYVTLSGGLCAFDQNIAFIKAAAIAQELMDISKSEFGKNAVTIQDSSHTYKWHDLTLDY